MPVWSDLDVLLLNLIGHRCMALSCDVSNMCVAEQYSTKETKQHRLIQLQSVPNATLFKLREGILTRNGALPYYRTT
jgi:hypothetical protein